MTHHERIGALRQIALYESLRGALPCDDLAGGVLLTNRIDQLSGQLVEDERRRFQARAVFLNPELLAASMVSHMEIE